MTPTGRRNGHRGASSSHAVVPRAVPDRPPSVVVLNPEARGGQAAHLWARVAPAVALHSQPTVLCTDSEGRWIEAVHEALGAGLGLFLAAGGDGTVNALVNALLSAPRPAGGGKEPSYMVGAIGLGSSNDFHKPWISCAAPVPLKTNPARSGRRDVGVARFVDAGGGERQRHFLVSASLGITAEANGRFNQPSPSRSWLKRHATTAAIAQAALETIATYRNVPARLSLTEGAEPPMEARITNLAITKTPYVSGWLRFDTEVPPADGRFFACLCDGFDRRRTLSALLDLSRGRYLARHRRGSHQWRTPGLTVETPQPVALELDGEVFRATRVTFTVLPKQLRCCT